MIPALWARAKIEDLMSQDLLGVQRGQPNADVRGAITQLGLDYGLMTQYTSFVAVEETTVQESGKAPRRIEVPVEMPEGVSYEGIYGRERGMMVKSAAIMHTFQGVTGGVAGGYPAAARAEVREMQMPAVREPLPSGAFWKISPALRAAALSGKVLVLIYVRDSSETTLKKLKDVGVEITANPHSGRIVVGSIDPSKLGALAALSEVRFIAPQQ